MMKTITINDLEIRNLEKDDCIILYSNDGIKKTPESTERVFGEIWCRSKRGGYKWQR
jgi:hypothetical protein